MRHKSPDPSSGGPLQFDYTKFPEVSQPKGGRFDNFFCGKKRGAGCRGGSGNKERANGNEFFCLFFSTSLFFVCSGVFVPLPVFLKKVLVVTVLGRQIESLGAVFAPDRIEYRVWRAVKAVVSFMICSEFCGCLLYNFPLDKAQICRYNERKYTGGGVVINEKYSNR